MLSVASVQNEQDWRLPAQETECRYKWECRHKGKLNSLIKWGNHHNSCAASLNSWQNGLVRWGRGGWSERTYTKKGLSLCSSGTILQIAAEDTSFPHATALFKKPKRGIYYLLPVQRLVIIWTGPHHLWDDHGRNLWKGGDSATLNDVEEWDFRFELKFPAATLNKTFVWADCLLILAGDSHNSLSTHFWALGKCLKIRNNQNFAVLPWAIYELL